MDILNQLVGSNGSTKSKWTADEEVAFFVGLRQGLKGEELARFVQDQVQSAEQRKTGNFRNVKLRIAAKLEAAEITVDSTQEEIEAAIRGQVPTANETADETAA